MKTYTFSAIVAIAAASKLKAQDGGSADGQFDPCDLAFLADGDNVDMDAIRTAVEAAGEQVPECLDEQFVLDYFAYCQDMENIEMPTLPCMGQHVLEGGELACEAQDLSFDECKAVGCCQWDNEMCWSAVGTGECIEIDEHFDVSERTGGELACEGLGFTQDECMAVGCCGWDNNRCWSVVGTDECNSETLRH